MTADGVVMRREQVAVEQGAPSGYVHRPRNAEHRIGAPSGAPRATSRQACGVEMPSVVNGDAQPPLSGVSMAYSFESDGPTQKQTLYYEMLGTRGIWHEDWKARAGDPARSRVPRPGPTDRHLHLHPGTTAVPEHSAANTHAVSFKILADVDFANDSEAVIVAQGSRFGGYALFVRDGTLYCVYNFIDIPPEQRRTVRRLRRR